MKINEEQAKSITMTEVKAYKLTYGESFE